MCVSVRLCVSIQKRGKEMCICTHTQHSLSSSIPSSLLVLSLLLLLRLTSLAPSPPLVSFSRKPQKLVSVKDFDVNESNTGT